MLFRRIIRLWPGFTITELLVVIAIIVILAGILLPALVKARSHSRMASCTGNLHQFFLSIEMYRKNFADFSPPWLSTLYPSYQPSIDMFICPADGKRGVSGGKPAWQTPSGAQWDDFAETDDTDDCQARDEVRKLRNPEVHACSYLFEFCWSECSWWLGGDWADFDKDPGGDPLKDGPTAGWVSWYEAKRTEINGWYFDNGKVRSDDDQVYNGWVPLIRCYWHGRNNEDLNDQPVLNVGCNLGGNVYKSNAEGDDWKNYARSH